MTEAELIDRPAEVAYAVCGSPNDLSEPVDSVWTDKASAVRRAADLNARSTYTSPQAGLVEWTVRAFLLNTPGRQIN